MIDMSKKVISIGLLLVSIAAFVYLLFFTDNKLYSAIPFTIMLIDLTFVFDRSNFITDNKEKYEYDFKQIMKTYYSILAELVEMPDFTEKDIVKVKSFNDLLNVQDQLQKPIYYLRNKNSISFMVIEESIVSIYSLKPNK